MAGRQRDPRTGRYTSGSVEGSEHGGTEGTSLVDVRASHRMSRNPSEQSSRRGSPKGRGLRRQLDWILEDIRPRLEWKNEPKEGVGIILEDLPDQEQVKWAAIQIMFLEEKTSGENTKRLEEYREEIKELYARVIRERERQREIIQEEMSSQRRLGKLIAKEVRAIKATMDSFITNDLSSHLAQAIQHHFGAFPIAQNIAQYFQENPISSIPPPHEQDAWKAAIEGVVLQHIQAVPAPPKTEDIVAQVTQNLRNELSSLKTEILQSIPKTISTEEIRRQINTAVSGLSGPSSQGISEDKCNRMIRTALAARIIPSSQHQQKIKSVSGVSGVFGVSGVSGSSVCLRCLG